ncbi:43745_t:CDS:2, partial [Gigaspora margarita]
MSETQDACLGVAEIIADTATEILAVYFPIVSTIGKIAKRIYEIYQDAECNKQICEVLAKRVKNAEKLIDITIKNIGKKPRKSFEEVSKYKSYIKYLNAKVTKERLKNRKEEAQKIEESLNKVGETLKKVEE